MSSFRVVWDLRKLTHQQNPYACDMWGSASTCVDMRTSLAMPVLSLIAEREALDSTQGYMPVYLVPVTSSRQLAPLRYDLHHIVL